MIPVAMTAAPRTEAVQERCIVSVLRAGFRDLTVFAEPGTNSQAVQSAEWVIWNPQCLGEYHNWLSALEWLLCERPAAPLLATCQDDIVLCHDVAAYCDGLEWPTERCGCVHLYTSKRYGGCYPLGRMSRLQTVHARCMSAACFLVFTRSAAEYLVSYSHRVGWRGHTTLRIETPHLMEGLDTFIGEALTAGGYEIWIHNPSMGQHIAKDSVLGHGGPYGARVAANWPGEAASAWDLFGGCSATRSDL